MIFMVMIIVDDPAPIEVSSVPALVQKFVYFFQLGIEVLLFW